MIGAFDGAWVTGAGVTGAFVGLLEGLRLGDLDGL